MGNILRHSECSSLSMATGLGEGITLNSKSRTRFPERDLRSVQSRSGNSSVETGAKLLNNLHSIRRYRRRGDICCMGDYLSFIKLCPGPCQDPGKDPKSHKLTNAIIYIHVYANPSPRAGCNTRSIFKQSLTGLNSEFSFSKIGC